MVDGWVVILIDNIIFKIKVLVEVMLCFGELDLCVFS